MLHTLDIAIFALGYFLVLEIGLQSIAWTESSSQ